MITRTEKKTLKQNGIKNKNFFAENKFFFGSFLVLVFYNFAVVNNFTLPTVEGERYAFHVVDFSFGFCSKFLQGAFFHLFVDEPTELKAAIYDLILLTVLFLFVSFFINVISKKISEEYHLTFAVLIAFFLTGPLTFSIFSYRLGMPDFSWILLTALFFLCFRYEKLWFVIPFLCVAGVMVHFGFMITYALLFFVMILYEAALTQEKKQRTKLYVLIGVSMLSAFAAFFYFAVNDRANLVMDREEFNLFLANKGISYNQQIVYYLYGDSIYPEFNDIGPFLDKWISNDSDFFVFTAIRKVLYTLLVQLRAYSVFGITHILLKLAAVVVFALPAVLFLYGFIRDVFTETNITLSVRRCVFFMFPAVFFLSVMFSLDTARWLAHALICLFSVVLYILFREKDRAAALLKDRMSKTNRLLIVVYAVLYFFSIVDPYTK